jgi:hypothetical protein
MDNLTRETKRDLKLEAFDAGQKAIEVVWKTVLAAYKISDQFALNAEVDYLYTQIHTEFDDRVDGSVTTPRTMSVLLTRRVGDPNQTPSEIYLHIPITATGFAAYQDGDQIIFEDELSVKPKSIYIQEILEDENGVRVQFMGITAEGIIQYPAISSDQREELATEFAFFLDNIENLDELVQSSDEMESMRFYAQGPQVDINIINTLRANIAAMVMSKQKILNKTDITGQTA